MKIQRLDLDGVGSPTGLVTRILEIEPNLPIPVPVEDLCERFDIIRIDDLTTDGFEAALITDALKSSGAILVAKDRSHQRRRFSIAHELGHFLIPAHLPPPGQPLLCSASDMRFMDSRDQDRHRRMEAEANRFAASLLMPPPLVRAELRRSLQPQITDITRLAQMFDVSKEAMARAYVEYSRHAVAVIVIQHGRVLRSYRNRANFPFISISAGDSVPRDSIYHDDLAGAAISNIEECEPELWLSSPDFRRVEILTEQVLLQRNGYALLLLHAELQDDEDEDAASSRTAAWR